MQSSAENVDEYLSALPEDRKSTISQVRKMILKNLQKGFQEGMQYGMIGYYVPHSVYPAGYHCKPQEPLPFLALASQKNYCSFYAMSLYSDEKTLESFRSAWIKTGKKLDMGKSCIRFKSTEDLAMDLIAKHIKGMRVTDYIARYEKLFGERKKKR